LSTFLSVLSSSLVGIILVVAPWTALWDANTLLEPYPAVRDLIVSPFTRGAVSGLGLVNILLAFYEARDHLARTRERP